MKRMLGFLLSVAILFLLPISGLAHDDPDVLDVDKTIIGGQGVIGSEAAGWTGFINKHTHQIVFPYYFDNADYDTKTCFRAAADIWEEAMDSSIPLCEGDPTEIEIEFQEVSTAQTNAIRITDANISTETSGIITCAQVEHVIVNNGHCSAWTLTRNSSVEITPRIMLHEIGHILGLGHVTSNQNRDKIMYYNDTYSTNPCYPTQEEINGVRVMLGYHSHILEVTDDYTSKCACGVTSTHEHDLSSDIQYTSVGHVQQCAVRDDCVYIEEHSAHIYEGGSPLYHIKGCNSCDYMEEEEHDPLYVQYPGNATYHQMICNGCGYSKTMVHDYQPAETLANEVWCYQKVCRLCGFIKYFAHAYTYTPQDDDGHKATCTVCEFQTEIGHDLEYMRYTETQHRQWCTLCDYQGYASHYVEMPDDPVVEVHCLACGEPINLNDDFVVIGSIQPGQVTANGSYVMQNGIVVLVEEDIEAFLAGTLVFYTPNDHEVA